MLYVYPFIYSASTTHNIDKSSNKHTKIESKTATDAFRIYAPLPFRPIVFDVTGDDVSLLFYL